MRRHRHEHWTCDSCGQTVILGHEDPTPPPRWHCITIAPGDPSFDADWKRYHLCGPCSSVLTNGVHIIDLLGLKQRADEASA